MNLYTKLQQRAADNQPIRIGLIGAGKFGSMYLAQIPKTPGVHLVAIADLSPDAARTNLARVGWNPLLAQAESALAAIKTGSTWITDDWRAVVTHPQIDIIVDQLSNSIGQVRAGNIRGYAVTDTRRVESAPDIPTVDEAGLPGLYISYWHGIWAPKNTPADIVAILNAAVRKALADPAVQARFLELGQETPAPERQTPAALKEHQTAEILKWWPIVKAANIKAE